MATHHHPPTSVNAVQTGISWRAGSNFPGPSMLFSQRPSFYFISCFTTPEIVGAFDYAKQPRLSLMILSRFHMCPDTHQCYFQPNNVMSASFVSEISFPMYEWSVTLTGMWQPGKSFPAQVITSTVLKWHTCKPTSWRLTRGSPCHKTESGIALGSLQRFNVGHLPITCSWQDTGSLMLAVSQLPARGKRANMSEL